MNGCPRGLRVLRVHVASGHERPSEPTKEWLLIEWPEGEKEPTRYLAFDPCRATSHSAIWLTAAQAAPWRHRARLSRAQGKRSGSGHYEGRGWRGFHHHATMCIAAYGFPDLRKRDDSPLRTLVPPSGSRNLPFPNVIDPEDPPLRPLSVNVPNSIATVRRRIIDALVRRLPRCPCCRAFKPRDACG